MQKQPRSRKNRQSHFSIRPHTIASIAVGTEPSSSLSGQPTPPLAPTHELIFFII